MNILMPFYSWLLAGHVVSVISWMAGMFYLPRLFVYHAEVAKPGSELDLTLQMMERKLLKLIMNPAMIATWMFGLILILMGKFDWSMAWPWVKLAAVLAMSGMHLWLTIRQQEFAAGRNTRSGRIYRLANEVPTLLMLVIVVMVIVRPF